MDEFESKFQNAKISALKEFYGKEKPGFEDGGRVAFVKGGVSIENQPLNLEKQKIYKKKVDRSAQLLRAGKTRAQVMRDIVKEFKLTREDKYAGTAPWLREAAAKVESQGYKITSGVLEQEGEGSKKKGRDVRRDLNKSRSNTKLEKAISGLKNSGFELSHAGFKNSPVGLHNLMYAEGRLNRKMSKLFEDPLFTEMEKFHTVYDNPEVPDQLKRQAAVKYAKNDRTLRQKFPEYAKLKTRLSFKNVPGDTSAFTVSEKLPDPSMAISTDKDMLLKGESPKSPKGMEIIKKANTSLALVLKKAGFKSKGEPNDPKSFLADINKQAELAKKGKSGSISKFNNTSTITKKLFKGIAAIDAPGLAIPFSAYSIKKLISDVSSGKKTNVTGADISLAPAFTHLAAKELGLYDKAATGVGKKLLRAGLTPTLAAKLLPGLSYGSTLALPFIETGIQGYNAYKDLEEAKKNSSVFEPTVDTVMGKAPKSYYNKMMSDIPAEGKSKTFNNPLTDKPMFTLPEVGISEFSAASGGIAGLLKK